MRSYLDLIPIFAKIHQRQNRMTLTCIMLAVFLVTSIFGMADMAVRSQRLQVIHSAGNWHVMISGLSEQTAAMIAARPEVKTAGEYVYLDTAHEYAIAGKQVQIGGLDKPTFDSMFPTQITEGRYPVRASEIVLSENAKFSTGAEIGDTLTLERPGSAPLKVILAGYVKGTSSLLRQDTVAVLFTLEGFRSAVSQELYTSQLLLKLSRFSSMQNVIGDITGQFQLKESQVRQNGNLLAALGQSSNSYVLQLYASAGVLSAIIVIAGVLMIASSLNSHVMQRTEFFGMMRCLGATRKQIMRFVRREALQWCKTAIPLGILTGTAVVWLLTAILKAATGEFTEMPRFAVSWIGLVSGLAVGILTVLLAARSPAKKASRVSPLTAANGSAYVLRPVQTAAKTAFLKVETALGIHHAIAGKKNFLMMVGSFSLSIVMFLCFSTTVDFMRHGIKPLKPWTPDISFASRNLTPSLDADLIRRIRENPAVKRVYGRMFAYRLPMEAVGGFKQATLISYEELQFAWAEKALVAGSIRAVSEQENGVLVVHDPGNPLQVGDSLLLNGGNGMREVIVKGVLSSSPYDRVEGVSTVIGSEELYRNVTGQSGYTVIDIQLSKGASDEAVNGIRSLVGADVTFSDRRIGNSEARGAFYSFALFVYGFLVVIALITVFHIVNNIAMSVLSRIRQYGAMRAIGMSSGQLVKMVTAEAAIYATAGSVAGCIIGLPLHKHLFQSMVTSRWGEPWQIPLGALGIILALVILTALLAVRGPARRIHNLSIVDTINAQ